MADIRAHIEALNEDIATRAAEGRDRSDLIAMRNELQRELLESDSHDTGSGKTPAKPDVSGREERTMTAAYRRDASFWNRPKRGGSMPKYHAAAEGVNAGGWARCSGRIMLDDDSALPLSDVPDVLRCRRCFPEAHDQELDTSPR